MDQDMTACSAAPAPETETTLESTPSPLSLTPQEQAIANLAQIAHLAIDLLAQQAGG
jgi:hypothetical protein